MNIPRPGHNYDKRVEDERNRIIEQADQLNYKRDADVRISTPYRLIVIDSTTGLEYEVKVTGGSFGAAPIRAGSAFGDGFSYAFL